KRRIRKSSRSGLLSWRANAFGFWSAATCRRFPVLWLSHFPSPARSPDEKRLSEKQVHSRNDVFT
ncbi:MAG: hypothetical protein WD049_07580, partial [Candidatus Paceibacterota bacterium]